MDMMKLMKQAQQMQAKMADMQAELEAAITEGQSGAGMVKVTMTGKGQLKSIAIDPSLMKEEEKEILEDLIIAAHADAMAKNARVMEEKMKSATAGLPIPPGMKLF
jgi:nucleoid-associated protein EbfC